MSPIGRKRRTLVDPSENDGNTTGRTIACLRVKDKLRDWEETARGIYVLSDDPPTIAVSVQAPILPSPLRLAPAYVARAPAL